MIQAISDATGLGVPTLKLLLTLLGGYPTAYIYRSLFLKPIEGEDKGKTQRSIFLTISGLFWAYFYNGNDIIHSLICIAFTYAVCYIGVLTKQRLIANGLVFSFNLIYLLAGYVFNMQGDYDVSWTMPHCVLCLRLIGFGFDVMDGGEQLKALEKGAKKEKDVVPDAQKTAPPKAAVATATATAPRGVAKTPVSFSGNCSLIEMPSILETLGYCYFFSAFLIGPQFSFRLYNDFIQLKNLPVEKDGKLPSGANRAALKAFLMGAFYLGLQQVLTGLYPASVFTSAEFDQKTFLSKLFFVWIYGRGSVSKYLGAWTLNEGAVILSGISYNGTDENGNPDWGGLTNFNPYGFETATALSQIIATFNINTNFWVKQYIFKRLRFLNNKQLSSLGALIFLAIWHGIWPGYFLCFFLEFLDMELETKLTKKFAPLTAKWNKNPVTKFILHAYCYLYTSSALFYALTAFTLLRMGPIIQAYNSIYWIGHVIVVVGLVFVGFIPKFKDPASKESLKKTE